ncbi:MAG: TetR/AcrR family transcriptional regulator [Lachnospiraceae bacterium]|nr:TetR/AcrR family transcriptional regulator [Lachnospiraceae bacterium]
MAGTDRRAVRTSRAIKEEVMRQMMKKKYQELTVVEICRSLDISRRTFYLHFLDIEDVFNKLFEEINAPLYRDFEKMKENMDPSVRDTEHEYAIVKEIFDLINAAIILNRSYLTRIAMEPSYDHILMRHVNLMKDMIRQAMEWTGIESDSGSLYLDYFISGVLEIYFQWYRGTLSLTLDEISSFAYDLFRTDLKYLDRKWRSEEAWTGNIPQ